MGGQTCLCCAISFTCLVACTSVSSAGYGATAETPGSDPGYPGAFTPEVPAYPLVVPVQDVPATLTAMTWTPLPHGLESTPAPLPEYILEGAFMDRSHGWLLGLSSMEGQAHYHLAATTDGGETWQAVRLPADPYQTDWWNQAHIFFADLQTGWVTYPGAILSTTDGGRTWKATVIPGVIRTLGRALDGTLWALEERDAVSVIWQMTSPSYTEWRDLDAHLPADLRRGAILVLLDAQEWWFSDTATQVNGAMAPQLHVSLDGGAAWEVRPSPCEDPRMRASALIALTHERVWFLCGAVWTSVESLKALYWSEDGGATWELRGRALGEPEDTLSSTGLLGAFGALSDDIAFLALDKTSRIQLTRDGGITWFSVPVPCSVDDIQVAFVDVDVGWAFGGSCVAHTIDGGLTWTCRGPDDGLACTLTDRPGPVWQP